MYLIHHYIFSDIVLPYELKGKQNLHSQVNEVPALYIFYSYELDYYMSITYWLKFWIAMQLPIGYPLGERYTILSESGFCDGH